MVDADRTGGPGGGVPLRVLCYNVHSQRDDVASLAAVVRGVRPDVVIVQEGPRRFRWRQKCASLADRLGLVVAAGGLPSLGNLLLTSLRVRVHHTWCRRYPLTPGRHMRGMAFAECSVGPGPDAVGSVGRRLDPAGSVGQGADVVGSVGPAAGSTGPGAGATPPGRARFVVAGSHLSTDPAERPGQAVLLKLALTEVTLPLVLGADFNENSGGAAWRTVADGLTDTAVAADRADRRTYSCANPRDRIDAVLVDPRITVVDYDVVDTPQTRRASDHFPVLVDLLLPG